MGTDGHYPRASLIFDAAANIYDGVSSIHLEEYGDDLDSSSLVFALDDYLKQQKPLSKPSPDR
jgi:hypothetical protein